MMTNSCRVPNPPINSYKIKSMFKQIDCLVGQLLDKISDILMSNGIRYFVKPNRESLLRMLTPYELKVYVDFTDVCCLFENRSDIIRDTIQRDNGNQMFHNGKKNESRSTEEGISLKDVAMKHKIQTIKQPLHLAMRDPQKYKNLQYKNPNQPQNIINSQFGNKYGEFRSLNTVNKYYVQNILKQKICEWAKHEISRGKTVTRIGVRNKAIQIGETYRIRFGVRWLNRLIGHDNDIRQLLTHGNSNELKKGKINNSYVNLKPGLDAQDVKQQNKQHEHEQQQQNSSLYGLYEEQEKQEGSPYMSQNSIQNNGYKTVESLAYPTDNSYKYYKQDGGVQHGYQEKTTKK